MDGEEMEEKKGRMEGVRKDLETLLRVLQVHDTAAAFVAMDIMEKEAADEEAEYKSEGSSEEDDEQEEEDEQEEDEQEIVGSDISGSDFE